MNKSKGLGISPNINPTFVGPNVRQFCVLSYEHVKRSRHSYRLRSGKAPVQRPRPFTQHAPDICEVKLWERLKWPSENVESGVFLLGQCRLKSDSEQTLSRHRPNISIVSPCRLPVVFVWKGDDKICGWACVLWRINPGKVFETRSVYLTDLVRSECRAMCPGLFDMFIRQYKNLAKLGRTNVW